MPPTAGAQPARGRAQCGTLLTLGGPLVAEMMATAGFDWPLADTEARPIDLGGLATAAFRSAVKTDAPCASA